MKQFFYIGMFWIGCLGSSLLAGELPAISKTTQKNASPPQDQVLTIYPEDLCLVKEARDVSLSEGKNRLLLEEIPSKLIEDSLLIQSPETLPLIFTEFSFHSDLLTFQNLLEKSIGEGIYILKTEPQKDGQKIPGYLLGIEKGKALVQIDSQIEMVPVSQIAFRNIPISLSLRPSLRVNVKSPQMQDTRLGLTYLTRGLSWQTNYTIEVDLRKNEANLMGWVTIKNTSGVHFKRARIHLASVQNFAGSNSKISKKPYRYPLSGETSLYSGTKKKVALSSAYKINAKKEYHIELPTSMIKNQAEERMSLETQVWFAIQNVQKNSLGFLLPPGKIKIYGSGSKQTRYIGSIDLKHINVGDSIYIPVDTCQIVDAQIQQTDFKQLGALITETAFRVTLTNKNTKPINIVVMKELPSDTTLMRSSPETHKIVDGKVIWPVEVPVNQTISLRYRLRTVREKAPLSPLGTAE